MRLGPVTEVVSGVGDVSCVQ